jgi:hypothetical protein
MSGKSYGKERNDAFGSCATFSCKYDSICMGKVSCVKCSSELLSVLPNDRRRCVACKFEWVPVEIKVLGCVSNVMARSWSWMWSETVERTRFNVSSVIVPYAPTIYTSPMSKAIIVYHPPHLNILTRHTARRGKAKKRPSLQRSSHQTVRVHVNNSIRFGRRIRAVEVDHDKHQQHSYVHMHVDCPNPLLCSACALKCVLD